jgi:hemerythrin
MPALTWTDQLALSHPQMDATHEEFVDLLAAADAALAASEPLLVERFEQLVAHTVAHFAQEDRWMAATGFAPENCHAFQHQAVLGVMQECLRRARPAQADVAADLAPLRAAVVELAVWFPHHAQMMDAALAEHMAAVGFDAASGQCRQPATADATPMTGCGGSRCG